MLQDRYEVDVADCVIRDNYLVANNPLVAENAGFFVIRIADAYIARNLMIMNNTIKSNIKGVGISIRNDMENLQIDCNYIEVVTRAIDIFKDSLEERKNVHIHNNTILGEIYISYATNLSVKENSITYNENAALKVYNSNNVIIEANTIHGEESYLITNCNDVMLGENNIFVKASGITSSKPDTSIIVKEATGQAFNIDSLTNKPCIYYYGTTQADLTATIEDMKEYTVFNSERDLTITIGDYIIYDTVPKYALQTKNGDIANYVDENGIKYFADYRNWDLGVDYHYINELVLTGNEKFYEPAFPNRLAIRLDWTFGNDDFNGLVDLENNYSRYDMPGVSNFYNSALGAQNPIYASGKKGQALDIYPNTVIEGLYSFDTIADFQLWCKEKYENGTPLKLLYPLAKPYTTPIPEAEMEAYNAIVAHGQAVTITSSANKKFDISYLLDDMYVRAVNQMIDKKTINTVTSNGVTGEATAAIGTIELVINGKQYKILYTEG
jgi:hypothetical protein